MGKNKELENIVTFGAYLVNNCEGEIITEEFVLKVVDKYYTSDSEQNTRPMTATEKIEYSITQVKEFPLMDKCGECDGKGIVYRAAPRHYDPENYVEETCTTCSASGWVVQEVEG